MTTREWLTVESGSAQSASRQRKRLRKAGVHYIVEDVTTTVIKATARTARSVLKGKQNRTNASYILEPREEPPDAVQATCGQWFLERNLPFHERGCTDCRRAKTRVDVRADVGRQVNREASAAPAKHGVVTVKPASPDIAGLDSYLEQLGERAGTVSDLCVAAREALEPLLAAEQAVLELERQAGLVRNRLGELAQKGAFDGKGS